MTPGGAKGEQSEARAQVPVGTYPDGLSTALLQQSASGLWLLGPPGPLPAIPFPLLG